MLPPIRKLATELPTEHRSNGRSDGSFDCNEKQAISAKVSSPRHAGVFEDESNQRAAGMDRLTERVNALERENGAFRQEVHHLRHLYSTSAQQYENEKLVIEKISDDLQRFAHSFNTKLQADLSLQQREQQKAALLFAEVARLGHRVETLECTVRLTVEDTQRQFEAQEQRATFLSTVKSNQAQLVSPTRNAQVQRQLMDIQEAMGHFRTEFDAERSARAINDAAVDAKVDAQYQKLHAEQMTAKRDLVRTLDEQRQLVTGVDYQRTSLHMREFARVNDQLIALERWVHHEFGQIKRVFQVVTDDVDARFQSVLIELANGLKLWHADQMRQEEEFRLKVHDLEQAVRDVVVGLQKKVCTLEQVVPLEVQTRQKSHDRLRKRVGKVVKALDCTTRRRRDEFASCQSLFDERVRQLEVAEQGTVHEITMQTDSMKETIEFFIRDANAMLVKIATASEQERIKGMHRVAARKTAPLKPFKVQLATKTRRNRQELRTLQARTERHEQKHCQCRLEVDALQAWSTMHAQECRLYLDFLCRSVTDVHREHAVAHCLDAVIDQIVETQSCERVHGLTEHVRKVSNLLNCTTKWDR